MTIRASLRGRLRQLYSNRHIIFLNIQLAFLLHLIPTHVGSAHLTYGPSMLPTLSVKGDVVFISKDYRRGRGIKVGDLVEFRHPMVPGEGAIKRVVGMPGDFVLQGKPVQRQPGEDLGVENQMLQVPYGHCWLLGDNLPESRDSRVYGPLPLALINGKVVARILPLSDAGWLKNSLQRPADTSQVA